MCALPDSHREDSYLYARHNPYIRNETQGLILESKGIDPQVEPKDAVTIECRTCLMSA